jgi:acyl-CoA thioesterase FadM
MDGHSRNDTKRSINLTINSRHEDIYDCTVAAYAEDTPVEVMSGYKLKIMEHIQTAPLAEELANPDWHQNLVLQGRLRQLADEHDLEFPEVRMKTIPDIHRLSKEDRHAFETALFRDTLRSFHETHHYHSYADELSLSWEDSGKPVLTGKNPLNIQVSFSHTDRDCICAVGHGPQGCDLEVVQPRTMEKWIALLGSNGAQCIAKINNGRIDNDTSGTIVWSIKEALIKSDLKSEMSVDSISSKGDLIIFNTMDAATRIITFSDSGLISDEEQHVISLLCGSRNMDNSVSSDPQQSGNGAHSYREQGPDGEIIFCHEKVVKFKDVRKNDKTVPLSVYADWMGELREIVLQDNQSDLLHYLSDGTFGMVTNNSWIELSGDVRALDIVEGRIWIDSIEGNYKSTINLKYEWFRTGNNGRKEKVAKGYLQTSWVRITGIATVALEPFPAELHKFFWQLNGSARQSSVHNDQDVVVPIDSKDQGSVALAEIFSQDYASSEEDSNLIGNIYFSNYYSWVSRTFMDYFYRTTDHSDKVERDIFEKIKIAKIEMNHLREAMPYDTIRVRLFVKGNKEVFDTLAFSIYKVESNSGEQKIAFGELDLSTVRRQGNRILAINE